ncbi:hypothetical protein OS493_019511, partial [Desmophyllum pertusum]
MESLPPLSDDELLFNLNWMHNQANEVLPQVNMVGASPKPPIATRPWEKVGMEIYSIHGSDYLITTDYFSSFTEEYDLKKDTKAPLLILEYLWKYSLMVALSSCARHLNMQHCNTLL